MRAQTSHRGYTGDKRLKVNRDVTEEEADRHAARHLQRNKKAFVNVSDSAIDKVLKMHCCKTHGLIGNHFNRGQVQEVRHSVWTDLTNITRQDWGVAQWEGKVLTGHWSILNKPVCLKGFLAMTGVARGTSYVG